MRTTQWLHPHKNGAEAEPYITDLTAPAAAGDLEIFWASKFLDRRQFFHHFWRCAGGTPQLNMLHVHIAHTFPLQY